MSALKTVGLYDKDSLIYYIALGIVILKDPIDQKDKIFYIPELTTEEKIKRALKMTNKVITSEATKREQYVVKELKEEV